MVHKSSAWKHGSTAILLSTIWSSRWWTVTSHVPNGVLPGLDDSGAADNTEIVSPCVHSMNSIPGIPAPLVECAPTATGRATWTVRTVTYNCTTLVREHDRQCLASNFARDGVHLVGLQETRTDPGPRTQVASYTVFSAPADKGNLGCQLWVHCGCAAASFHDGDTILFEAAKAAFLCAEPRLLAVVLPAGKQLFACVVAHAPVADSPAAVLDEWWTRLEAVYRMIPRTAIPLLFMDANARFRSRDEAFTALTGEAVNSNAECFQDFLQRHQLTSCSSRDFRGDSVVSWTAPSGHTAQLDYVAFAEPMEQCAVTKGVPWSFVDPVGFDHSPVQVDFAWTTDSGSQSRRPCWDRSRMRTAEGRAAIKAIMDSCPAVPWHVHPENHLQIINDHIFQGLQTVFPAQPAKPRARHISDELWQCVRDRRHSRRLVHRNKVLWHKYLLQLLFTSWKAGTWNHFQYHVTTLSTAWHGKCRRLRLANARLAKVIRVLTACIRKLDQRDAAAHTREVLRHARTQGPVDMAQALRGVMKMGRRYKTPRVAPTLCLSDGLVCEPARVKQALAAHFAEPENGQPSSICDIVVAGHHDAGRALHVDTCRIPSLPLLAGAFMELKPGKAMGLSCIPAEIYAGSPIAAALLHLPLLVKSAATGVLPTLWRGSQSIALAKPGKAPTSLAGWRSIALYDCAAKGLGKALRRQLAASLRSYAADGQHGSLAGDALPLPAHCVQSFLSAAAAQNKSCAILFLDGKSAYYALIRQRLFTCTEQSDVDFLEQLFKDLLLTDEQQSVVLAAMRKAGALSAAGVHPALEAFLHQCLNGTWFTMGDGSCSETVYWTRSGSVPGTPLADLLFAFIQAEFYRAVQSDLCNQGIRVTFGSGPPAPLPGWADDVSILLPFCDASVVPLHVAAAVASADFHSRCTGVRLNFEQGKTEALCCFRGRGSREVRRTLLSVDCPSIPVQLRHGGQVAIRMVDAYTHLGFRVMHTASPSADVQRKIQLAMPTFERLRRTLLRNSELTAVEKTELVRSLVISKSCFGAALWNPTCKREEQLCHTALHKFWRRAFRHITGHSAIFLTDEEVCCALHTLDATNFFHVERLRQLHVIVSAGPCFLWDCLVQAGSWLRLALHSFRYVCSQLDVRAGAHMADDVRACLSFLRTHCTLLGRLPRRFSRAAVLRNDGVSVIAKARASTDLERMGWQPASLPCPDDLAHVRCHLCAAQFRTKAAKAVHMANRHRQCLITPAATGHVCHVCGQNWWSTFRLREHLRRSRECRIVWNCADLPEPLPHEKSGSRKEAAWRPPMAVCGPPPFWATLRPDTDDFEADGPIDVEGGDRLEDILRTLNASFSKTEVGAWFQQLFRTFLEFAESAEEVGKKVGGFAMHGIALCPRVQDLAPGEVIREGIFCCQLGERRHVWLKFA